MDCLPIPAMRKQLPSEALCWFEAVSSNLKGQHLVGTVQAEQVLYRYVAPGPRTLDGKCSGPVMKIRDCVSSSVCMCSAPFGEFGEPLASSNHIWTMGTVVRLCCLDGRREHDIPNCPLLGAFQCEPLLPQSWSGLTIFARRFASERADYSRGHRYSFSSALLVEIRSSGGFCHRSLRAD